MNASRFVRTLANLHPLQIFARGPHAAVARLVRGVPTALSPQPVADWPEAPLALRYLANAERARGASRLARLRRGSRLRAYEACYGLELGADDAAPMLDGRSDRSSWRSRVALEPYPASVRARRIAVAIRCGRRDLGEELARAARSVLLQLEMQLLGNHLLENGFALVCAGAVTRGLEANLWWSAGSRLLSWQLPQQFLADGGHVERSASYHVALTAALLEATELAEASGRGAPLPWRETATRALGWMAAVRAPDGTYPLFNDAALDAAPTIDEVSSLGAAMSVQPIEITRVHCVGNARSTHLEATGWVRLDVGDACLLVDAGPDVDGWQPGHAHADGLTFELWADGKRAIVDFGIATYESGPERVATRATAFHNTVELDGQDSCEVWGEFLVGRRGRGRVISCEVSDGDAQLVIEHDGYAWMHGKPMHHRALTLKARSLEVRDAVEGGGGRAVSRLRVHPAAQLRAGGTGDVREAAGIWHPRHGDPHPAIVFSQRFRPGERWGAMWHVEW